MNYDNTIAYLYGLQKHGIKLGLDNPKRLMSLLGHPHDSFRSIHVAGTNGKGSTSAMAASMLKAAGFKTGLFTSPHMVSFTERIRVDGIEITEDEVVELTNEVREVIKSSQQSAISNQQSELNPTFFEFVTAVAFLHFKKKGVEWAVVETGMGGRLDATNVIMPDVSVITNISYDHKEFLGNSLREIAGEKAGIIKEGVPVVSASQEDEAMGVINQRASEKKADFFIYGKDFKAEPKKIDMHGIVFDYKGESTIEGLYVPLCGMHQMENTSLALKAIEIVSNKLSHYASSITDHAIREGLANISWPGRLELAMIHEGCDILIDGAHNPSAAQKLAETLNNYFAPHYQSITLIFGIMADKEVIEIMRPLLPLASRVIMTSPEYERAASPERLSFIADSLGFKSITTKSVKEAIDMAIKDAADKEAKTLIVITGSFYTLGDAKIALGEKGILTTLRETR